MAIHLLRQAGYQGAYSLEHAPGRNEYFEVESQLGLLRARLAVDGASGKLAR